VFKTILVKRLNDLKYMRLALSLARKGKGKVSPNPMVGCVVVNEGKIVGRGYHEYFGGPHAEINALSMAGEKAVGSTLYTTLEPCNHFGKTPPCTDAIIRAGVKRVVAAALDPDEKMRGRGLKTLTQNAIEVSQGILKRESTGLNSEYLKSRKDGITEVIVKAAMSVDGKIATRTGDSKWITSVHARKTVHKMRSNVDAIVVGRETVLRDNPGLTSHGLGRNPVRVVLDSNLTIPLGSRVFDQTAPTIVFFSKAPSQNRLDALRRKKIMAVRMPSRGGIIDFKEVMGKLKEFSLRKVLVEGGGETIASAISSGMATDLVLFIAPKIIGGKNAKTPVEGLGVAAVRNALHLRRPRVTKIGQDFLLTAQLNHKS
jgi:diaminohydroxyphosphoribosylaminopyrimidine deaminase/5-amino-6-(5-phosphoribosylamino)uracil reductase